MQPEPSPESIKRIYQLVDLVPAASMSAEKVAAATEEVEQLAVDDDELNLDFGKKKKKKSSKAKEGAADGEAAAAGEGGEDGAAVGAAPGGEEAEDELSLDLSLGKKKKKKKAKARGEDEFGGLEEGGGGGEEGGAQRGGGLPWEGSDRDYTYDELLDRVFGILKAHNPELTGERRRTTLKPPQVAREGTKKTVFTNFMELCKSMNRNHEHVLSFLLSELGTSGSLDGTQRLIVKGRFLPKAFETVLRRYINDYVLCSSCKSVDTLLDRDSSTRIMFLRCQQCSASRTVAAIKTGYQARTVSRKSQQTG